jgi:hypothetical protein
MSEMANREHRAGVRVEHEMPLRWYAVPDPGAQASAHDGTTVDAGRHPPPVRVAAPRRAAPARVVRVTRAAGGYRCAVQFVRLDPAHRAALGKFVFALIRAGVSMI